MADAPVLDQAPSAQGAASRLGRQAWKWLAPFIGLIIVLVFFGILTRGSIVTSVNVRIVSQQTVIVGVCAIGMTFIMVGGGIDLSVGSVMALCSVVLALALEHGLGSPAAVIIAILVGGLCGLINALLITGLRIVPFIVTLGMLSIARGLARALAGNRLVRLDERPEALADFVKPLKTWTWLAPSVWVMFGVAILAGVVINYTAFGRRTVAIGSNELAARLSGVVIHRQKWMLYALGGMLTGLAGAFLFANTVEGDPSAAVGMELQVIAAVVIGGGSLMGGEGSVLGTVIGAFMLVFLVNGCTLAHWPNWVQEIIIGAIIVLAVALDYFRRKSPG